MKKILITTASVALSAALIAGCGKKEEVKEGIKIGILMGYTGPIESLTPDMSAAVDYAVSEVNTSGKFLGGTPISTVRADSTCVDSAAATTAAERLITSDGISGLIGADCSGVTIAVLSNVAIANGMVMISPSATSPALTTTEDNGLFFRTSPSDARQGEVMADVVMDQGYSNVALTYTNNDYGKGLADAFEAAFTNAGGTVTTSVPHEDGKADYSAEVSALSSAGGEVLVVVGYLDQGGKGIVQASLDSGAFDTFVLPDAMVGDSLPAAIGPKLNGSFGQLPGTDSEGSMLFIEMAAEEFNSEGPFTASSYDAAALMLLAMQAANSSDPADYQSKVFDVANAPGVEIGPGELGKALELLADGQEIDYVGASDIELIGPGENGGRYREIIIADEAIETVGYR
ncbi:MAG: ABC transporter substrate-binding protein [Alphaproteobacteria bacterium]|nr:ABC transporter substrate-binding protein [Alphaproteobacteria bacterium]